MENLLITCTVAFHGEWTTVKQSLNLMRVQHSDKLKIDY